MNFHIAKPLRIIYIFAILFLIHPVLADERKTETINLESLKKNWVDEINNTEYIQQLPGSFSQKIYHHQIAIAMAAIVMVQTSPHGKNA